MLPCLVIAGMQAQKEDFRQELAIGASFGTTFSRIDFVPKVNQKMIMGYTGGLTVRWETEKYLGLQGELNFVQQGWEEKFDNEPSYRYKRTINYVELPIFTHVSFGSDKVKVFLNVGPKIGYMFSEKTDDNLNGAEANRVNEQHYMSVEKKFDWGLCGGPGVEFRTGIGYFLLEGRYYYALGDTFKSRKEDFFSKSTAQVISAKLTYLFPLGKK